MTRRASNHTADSGAPIDLLTLHADIGDITVEVVDPHTVKVAVPDRADTFVALSARSDAECLAEELRHLHADATYARALAGLAHVQAV